MGIQGDYLGHRVRCKNLGVSVDSPVLAKTVPAEADGSTVLEGLRVHYELLLKYANEVTGYQD